MGTNLRRRQLLHLAAGALATPVVVRVAQAQTWPNRPITLVVPYPPGGPTDTIGRLLAERMRASVEEHRFVFGDAPIPVTISVGISCAPGLAIATTVDFVARADEALYAAKRAGRNRVVTAEAPPSPPVTAP